MKKPVVYVLAVISSMFGMASSHASSALTQAYKQSDQQMTDIYRSKLNTLDNKKKKQFRQSQVSWINTRYRLCGGSQDRLPTNASESECYTAQNKKRIASLVQSRQPKKSSLIKQASYKRETKTPVKRKKRPTKQYQLSKASAMIYNLDKLTDGFKPPQISTNSVQLSQTLKREVKGVRDCDELKAYIAKQLSYRNDINDHRVKRLRRTCMTLDKTNQVHAIGFQRQEQYQQKLTQEVIPLVVKSLNGFDASSLCEQKQASYVCFQNTEKKGAKATIYPVMKLKNSYYNFVDIKPAGLFKSAQLYTVIVNGTQKSKVIAY